jgi:hypothetical protein
VSAPGQALITPQDVANARALVEIGGKAQAFDTVMLLLQEIEDLEANIARQRRSRSGKGLERTLEMDGRLKEARDLLKLMRQRWSQGVRT